MGPTAPEQPPRVASLRSGLDCVGGVFVASVGVVAGGSLVLVVWSIKWATHAYSGIGDGLHVDHRRADVFVTHELLYGTWVVSGSQHLGSEGSA